MTEIVRHRNRDELVADLGLNFFFAFNAIVPHQLLCSPRCCTDTNPRPVSGWLTALVGPLEGTPTRFRTAGKCQSENCLSGTEVVMEVLTMYETSSRVREDFGGSLRIDWGKMRRN
jgi:hypothetical protein